MKNERRGNGEGRTKGRGNTNMRSWKEKGWKGRRKKNVKVPVL
jgi:hypothetical protein